jgi:hypothetical protein
MLPHMCVVGSWQMVIIAFDVEALYDSGEGTLPTNIKITWAKGPLLKSDSGGIRTHARKTAALTQRLRPLGHRVL